MSSQIEKSVKVGCCGFAESQRSYFSHFRLIEIQQTFYQLPQLQTARKWRKASPPNFEFTIKAWQLITHEPSSPTYRRLSMEIAVTAKSNYGFFKPTAEVWQAWEATRQFARELGAKIILFQCPASFKPSEENISNLRSFFSSIPHEDFVFVWEPRGHWQPEEIAVLCQELDLIHGVDPFQAEPVFGNICYFRLHGKGGYRYHYTEQDLEILYEKCRHNEKLTYVLFNNVSMLSDAQRFLNLLQRRRR